MHRTVTGMAKGRGNSRDMVVASETIAGDAKRRYLLRQFFEAEAVVLTLARA